MDHERKPGIKLTIAGLVATLLAVPLFMVFLLVYDRENQSEVARASIAQGWGGPQRIAGPLLALPYSREQMTTVKENGRDVTRTQTVWSELYLAPATLRLDTSLQPERRSRSIYQAVVYASELRGRARFQLPAADLARLGVDPAKIAFERAELRFGVSDPRALKLVSRIAVGGAAHAPQPGNGPGATGGAGFFVPLDAGALRAGTLDADFQLGLRGHTMLALVPRAGRTEWSVRSPWPHPSFTGRILPDAGTTVSADGFSATWRTSHFATNLAQLHQRCAQARQCDAFNQHTVAVSFIQPVDLYQTVERSVKYGFLFILLTFAAFFLFEILGRLAIHPVQYGLVGVALSVFFLLLISLAEHLGFAAAYAIATAACVGLIGYYVGHVLKSWRRGGAFAIGLASLYGLLYVLLRLEDHALLLGSLLVFACLAAAMIATRRVDWYAVSANAGSTAPKPA